MGYDRVKNGARKDGSHLEPCKLLIILITSHQKTLWGDSYITRALLGSGIECCLTSYVYEI